MPARKEATKSPKAKAPCSKSPAGGSGKTVRVISAKSSRDEEWISGDEYPPVVSQEITSRCCHDRMVTSHISMVLPCVWWVFTEFNSTYNEQLKDRLMAMIMIVAVALSIIYHLYYERVLCNAETEYLLAATALLNVYMWSKGIAVLSIAAGLPVLGFLQYILSTSRTNNGNKRVYNERHHWCHHIAGVYITFCVYLIRTRPGLGGAEFNYMTRAVNTFDDPSTGIKPPFPGVVADMLRDCDQTFLATAVGSSPHLSLMKFTYYQPEEVIILSTQRGTKKFKFMETNPKVALLFHDFIPPTPARPGHSFSVTLNGVAAIADASKERFYRDLHLRGNPDYSQFIEAPAAIVVVKVDEARIVDVRDNVTHWKRKQ